MPEWKAAVADEDSLARHRKQNPKLHDKLGRIEVMLEREMSAPQFDRQHVKSEILAISDPERYEILRAKEEAEQHARQEEERIRQEQERLIQQVLRQRKPRYGIIFQIFVLKSSRKRLNGNDRYSSGTVKAWHSFMRLYGCFDKKHQYTWGMVNREFVAKFLAFMEKEGYMVTAQNKYLVTLRALIGYAYTDGIHDNDRATQCFSKKKIEEKTRLPRFI